MFFLGCKPKENRITNDLAFDNKREDSLIGVIELFIDQLDYKSAWLNFDSLVGDKPLTPRDYMIRGRINTIQGNVDEAKADYNKIISMNYRKADAYFNLAFVAIYAADFDGAIVYLDSCIVYNPLDTQAINARERLINKAKNEKRNIGL